MKYTRGYKFRQADKLPSLAISGHMVPQDAVPCDRVQFFWGTAQEHSLCLPVGCSRFMFNNDFHPAVIGATFG